jgi:hypothetical protein
VDEHFYDSNEGLVQPFINVILALEREALAHPPTAHAPATSAPNESDSASLDSSCFETPATTPTTASFTARHVHWNGPHEISA